MADKIFHFKKAILNHLGITNFWVKMGGGFDTTKYFFLGFS